MTYTIALIITTSMATITDMDISAMGSIAMGIISPAITMGGIWGGIGALASLACRDLGFTVGDIRDCIGDTLNGILPRIEKGSGRDQK